MATTSLYRGLLIVGLLACLAASKDPLPNFGGDCTGPNPEPLDQNYNIPYSPDDFDREAAERARDAETRARADRANSSGKSPTKRQADIKIYSCGGEGTQGHKREEHNSCGCNAGRKHSPPTKRRDTSMCGSKVPQDHKRDEHNSCGCNSGRKHSPPTKREDDFKYYISGGGHKRQEQNSSASVSEATKPSFSPVPVEMFETYPGSGLAVPAAELEVLKQWAAEGKYTGCNSGMKNKLPTKRQEQDSPVSASGATQPSYSPVPVEMFETYPGSGIAVPASELEVLKQWAAEGKYTGCNAGMKNKLPAKRQEQSNSADISGAKPTHSPIPVEMFETYPGSDLAVPASELEVLKQWAAEGKHPEITANMNKHPLSKRLPASFDSFEDVKKHREDLKEQKEQLSRQKDIQKERQSYERQRSAAIADVDVKIEHTRAPKEDGDLPALIKIKITNNSKWKITFCDKTSPISSNAYKMGFFEVMSHNLRANIAAPASSTSAIAQPTWEECGRDLFSGESASTWITFPPPDALEYSNFGSLEPGDKYDVRLTGVWHGIQATGDPEVDPRWDTNEWSPYAHPFSSNTITIAL